MRSVAHGIARKRSFGTGKPDTEGITVGPDGSLFITTERDNAASGVPLDSILKFDPTTSETSLSATDQWVLTPDLDFTAADANLGFEGVAYVPDSALTAAGFTTDDGSAYDPADYAGKLPGVYFGAVEKTGHLRAYVLKADHTWTRIADVDTGTALAVGLGMAVVCLLLAGMLRAEWAYAAGNVVQVAAIGLGFVVPVMFGLGAVFAALWAGADLLGRKIERERAAAWAAYRRENG